MAAKPQVDWYFDVLSPYAYFAVQRLGAFDAGAALTFRPVVFAAILNHWGQKGPAEIPGKREAAYRWCTWTAEQRGLPFKMPAAHPFNPIAWLRLIVAAGCTRVAVDAVFNALWTTGADPTDGDLLADTAKQLGVEPQATADQAVKDALRQSTDDAIAAGVFGVPTLRVRGELFWGDDAMDFALAYLRDPELLATERMQRAAHLPTGVTRKQT